ncbi:Cathepsin L [Spironucleus salmonicida]|uniref:Cathepsin L n=1 Tax=Spironucleus salmonicida TaxID=348837 RepID=V6LBA7_9EUKA|nr:Cathepsin L [Spironucleus salmonicida]|eukprot:EST41725.1 Cathepsin L [Spironucleus salmonicida]
MNILVSSIFTSELTFIVPYANNTQRYYVTQNSTHQYFHILNAESEISNKYILTDQAAYYIRTQIDKQSCINSEKQQTIFVPNLSEYDYLKETVLNGKKVQHFRKFAVISNEIENMTFFSSSNEQQDFYCIKRGDMCIPVRWEMNSISNFNSHKDLYIIDYNTFEPKIEDSFFAIPEICIGSQQILKTPTEHNKPSGRECWLSGEIADSIDWRVRGISTPVKDQIACGSCWTFATAGAIEGRINVLRNQANPIRISEQSIVDCFWDQKDKDSFLWSQGCEGGQPDNAMKFFIGKNLALEKNYPYYGQNDFCKAELLNYTEFKVVDVCQVPNDVNQLKLALMEGPVAVTIDVTKAMSQYAGGVFNDQSCKTKFQDLVHNVLCVGYGKDEQHGEYWIIKNSWSNNWGVDGYIYISIKNNICGVLTDAAYPVIERS